MALLRFASYKRFASLAESHPGLRSGMSLMSRAVMFPVLGGLLWSLMGCSPSTPQPKSFSVSHHAREQSAPLATVVNTYKHLTDAEVKSLIPDIQRSVAPFPPRGLTPFHRSRSETIHRSSKIRDTWAKSWGPRTHAAPGS